MGWDAGLDRKLAVPLALGRLWQHNENKMARNRVLKDGNEEDLRMLMTLADNRERLQNLREDIENDPVFEDTEDMKNDLDYINAYVQLGILEITGELEEIQSSEEVFEEALA
jgi:hypothetical protein